MGWAKKSSQATPKKQKDKKKRPKAYWNKGLHTSKLWKSNWWQFIEEQISFFMSPAFNLAGINVKPFVENNFT